MKTTQLGLSSHLLPISIVVLITGACVNAEVPRIGPSWDFSHGDLQVSENGRYLVHKDGTPFFYLSDTNWDLFRRARREDVVRLINKRREQGFTVICGPVTGNLDAYLYKRPLEMPNPYDDLPFIDKDFARPDVTPGADPSDPEQYDYWDNVDYIVSVAESNGIYVAMMPAWDHHVRSGMLNSTNVRPYIRFLGERYGTRPNIIWVLGADHDATGREDLFREMADELEKADPGNHLMCYHPRGGHCSSDWFHNDEWLDFNMLQSGHGSFDRRNDLLIERAYNLKPVKPVMDSENRYEDHAVAHDPEKGFFKDYDNRQAAYWALFAGAHGHTYGSRSVWQMYEPGREPYRVVRYYWYDAMDFPGCWDMLHVRDLMLSRPFLSRVPDQSLVEDMYSGADTIRATRGDDYAFIYAATGRTFTVNLGKISGPAVVAWWFDPRTGEATRIGRFPNKGVHEFDPPGAPKRGNDWVLVLDDASKAFGAPGADSTIN